MTVGAVGDAIMLSMGVNPIRWAIRSAALAAFIGIAVYFIAARYFRDDLEIGLR